MQTRNFKNTLDLNNNKLLFSNFINNVDIKFITPYTEVLYLLLLNDLF